MDYSGTKIPSIWTTGWTDVLNTGTWRNAIAVHQKRKSPCHGACPVGGEIPVWVQKIRNGDYRGAWETLVENNPLPASVGRVCHHPCEGKCNRGDYDEAVTVNAMEQYVGDMAIREGWTLPQPPLAEAGQGVAVVGGGPAGLSCAWQLRRKGVQVTLYDANPEPGGVLRYGIPEYRLPKATVDAEVKRLREVGVEFISGRRVTGKELDELQKEYAAVFVAFGAHQPKRLPQFSGESERVCDALSFLAKVKAGVPVNLGRRVVVIGGGSVAMDVAGSAMRLGSQVSILSLEGRQALPATEEEIVDVLEEGARLFDGAMIKKVESFSSSVRLSAVRVDLDPDAPAGVLRPVERKGTDFSVETDMVILAVGQDPHLEDWASVLKIEQGMAIIDENFRTSNEGVFAAGDLTSSERYVSTAIGDGKRAAERIASYLSRYDGLAGTDPLGEEVTFKDINTFYFQSRERQERGKEKPVSRISDFREIRLGLTDEQVQAQAERCFSCGNCVECDNCFYFCPDMAIVKDESMPAHYHVLDQYCKGCGCCLEECPRGALGVKEESK